MQDAVVMRGGQSRANLPCDFDRFVARQTTNAPQQRRQILAIDELHRKKVPAIDLADVIDAADIRMRDLPSDADFVVKARQRSPIEGDRVRQELERDNLFEFEILSLIDFAHPAATHQTDDAITLSQHGPCSEPRAVART